MFYNVDSGLYLTQYRAYDPNAVRWLSRDPAGRKNGSTSLTENGSFRWRHRQSRIRAL
jgi:RHS repeat-associated protein